MREDSAPARARADQEAWHASTTIAETDIWPELGSNQSVLARLKRIAGLGYPMALPWSYLQRDTHTTWTTIVEHHLRVFRDEQAAAGPINAPPA